jgi:hypothetical protein
LALQNTVESASFESHHMAAIRVLKFVHHKMFDIMYHTGKEYHKKSNTFESIDSWNILVQQPSVSFGLLESVANYITDLYGTM